MTKYVDLKTKKDKIAFIKEQVSYNPKWATRALMTIYDLQTSDEQASGYTQNWNYVGFNGVDSEILSSFAEQVNKGRTLSEKQMKIIFKKMPKYAKQLMNIADKKH